MRFRIFVRVLATCASMFATAAAQAATIAVSNGGDLQAAINQAQPGDVITHRIRTATGAAVSIEEGTNAGLAEWGWADNSYGGLGNAIYFDATGPQTIRVQVREDGLSLDQIVLSSGAYVTVAPGAPKNDTTILTK